MTLSRPASAANFFLLIAAIAAVAGAVILAFERPWRPILKRS
jgi:hypothetical protein